MINYKRLLELMDGDHEFADKLIQSFKEDAESNINLLKSYLTDENYELLSNTAHVLKTQAGYLGLENLQELSKNIELQALDNPSKEQLTKLLKELEYVIQKVLKECE